MGNSDWPGSAHVPLATGIPVSNSAAGYLGGKYRERQEKITTKYLITLKYLLNKPLEMDIFPLCVYL